ncbi:MAG: phosphatidate cytidylyltransferase [Sphingopyxis sp.]|nr:phosphatidate cytidylyltransferase [Sphingopyxis sp.]
MTSPTAKSDLGTRILSAIVMVAVAGTALWFGGWVFTAFVLAVGLGVLWEWWGLASKIAKTPFGAMLWMVAGSSYVAVAMAVLVGLREFDIKFAVLPILLVIAVDVGAYFAGRTIGGPKIAPSISPSKTWAGLAGGAVVASLVAITAYTTTTWNCVCEFGSCEQCRPPHWPTLTEAALLVASATLLAIIAQTGDFFESWMKRRAGVKDSGSLIPGHGGLLDRVDGLLAVLFVGGLVWLVLS